MSDNPQVHLSLLARQQGQILSEMGTIRDDLAVPVAIVQRLDGTVADLVHEIRATHAQLSRMREVESKVQAP